MNKWDRDRMLLGTIQATVTGLLANPLVWEKYGNNIDSPKRIAHLTVNIAKEIVREVEAMGELKANG